MLVVRGPLRKEVTFKPRRASRPSVLQVSLGQPGEINHGAVVQVPLIDRHSPGQPSGKPSRHGAGQTGRDHPGNHASPSAEAANSRPLRHRRIRTERCLPSRKNQCHESRFWSAAALAAGAFALASLSDASLRAVPSIWRRTILSVAAGGLSHDREKPRRVATAGRGASECGGESIARRSCRWPSSSSRPPCRRANRCPSRRWSRSTGRRSRRTPCASGRRQAVASAVSADRCTARVAVPHAGIGHDEPAPAAKAPAPPPTKPARSAGRPQTAKNSGMPFDPIKVNGPIFDGWPKPKLAIGHYRHGGGLLGAVRLRGPGPHEGRHEPPRHALPASFARRAGRWSGSTWAGWSRASAARRS